MSLRANYATNSTRSSSKKEIKTLRKSIEKVK